MQNKHIRIAITGPESTGKSYISQKLAQYFQVSWVKEYAREYIETLQSPYQEEDLRHIAEGQVKNEQLLVTQNLLFCDTELTVIDIWSQEKFGRTHPWIQEQMKKHTYDLYLLMDTDLSWQSDPQRENPDDRERLLSLYIKSFEKRNLNYYLISGFGDRRFNNALIVVKKFLANLKESDK